MDLWKGLSILGVVHLHTTFWSGMLYLPNWARTASLLVDVPVFFFISGFLLASGNPSTLASRLWSQAKRIVVLYLAVALPAIAMSASAKLLFHRELLVSDALTSVGCTMLLVPNGVLWELWMVLPGSLWFIRAYLETLPLMWILLGTRAKPFLPAIPLATLVVMGFLGLRWFAAGNAVPVTDSVLVTLSAFLFLSCGAAFRLHVWSGWNRSKSLMAIAVWLGAMAVAIWQGGPPDLTFSKFPPTVTYIVYNFGSAIGLVCLMDIERRHGLSWIPGPLRKFLQWCGANVFELFLAQGLVTSIPIHLVPALQHRGISTVAIYGSMFVWNLVGSVLLAWIVTKLPLPTFRRKSPLPS